MKHIVSEIVKKYLDPFARYGGIVTICLEWLAVLIFYILRPAEFSGEHTISYFASLPETRIVFSVCLTVAATSFWIFTTFHLPKYYAVPTRLFALSMLGYGVMALTPYNPDDATSDLIHSILALSFGLTFLAGIYLMGKNSKDSAVRLVSYLTAVLSGLVLFIFIVTPKGSQFVLLLEAISAFIGQAWVIWISFHSFKADIKR